MSQFDNIRGWAAERNLIEGTDSFRQSVKLMEEVGELASGVARSDRARIEDGIGDAVVVLTILAAQQGRRIEECIETAWNESKDRKGRMVNGVFVKEADLG